MKRKNRALAALMAVMMLIGITACQIEQEAEQPPEEAPVVQQPEPQEPVESPQKPMEQAGLVDSDLMLRRVKENLLSPLSATIRCCSDVGVQTQLNEELLEEMAGFLCQNYTVLREDAQVNLKDSLYLQVIGAKESHDIYICTRSNEEGVEETFVQVHEGDVMGQYVYDISTYGAIGEVLEYWQYENKVVLDGSYRRVLSQQHLLDLRHHYYDMNYLMQFDDRLLYVFDAGAENSGSIVQIINAKSGASLQSFTMDKPLLDIRNCELESYDFCLLTADSIHYRSSEDSGLKMDFQLPQSIKDKLLKNVQLPLFDLNHIKDLLVYASEEGIVLSNQAGKRNDLILRNEHLPELLGLSLEEGEEQPQAVYAAPQLMNNGKLVVAPILLEGQWAGFSIFNLMQGTSSDYINQFENIRTFTYPDDQTIRIYGDNSLSQMDVLSREITQQQWSCENNEISYCSEAPVLITWRKGMNYSNMLVSRDLSGDYEEELWLTATGDRFHVYGVTEDYALVGWSDSSGDRLAVVDICADENAVAGG